jgi:hypothetical protein
MFDANGRYSLMLMRPDLPNPDYSSGLIILRRL